MSPKKLLATSNRETESRALEFVIAYEKAVGRTAVDARRPGSPVDVESSGPTPGEKRLIEVKAVGGDGRGDDLWLEPNQVAALSEVPGSHLYLVINAKAVDASEMRILDLTGEQLRERLEKKREKHYFEVPLPVAVYDDLLSRAMNAPTATGAE